MKKLCIFFLVFLLFVNISYAQEIPTLNKYVNDLANVLSASEENRINTLCAEIEKNWTVEIAVLTVKTTQPMTIEEYAVKTFENNGIGKKDKDNGLLIVAAIEDREWRFEVGYGLEPIITDATAGRIGSAYLTTYFKEGKYGDGLYYAVDAVNKIFQNGGDDSFISKAEYDASFIPMIFLILMFSIFPLIIIILIFVNFFVNRCPECGTRMKCHYDKNHEYMICECPKCGKKVKKKQKRYFWFFVGGLGGRGGFGGGGGGGFGGGGSGGGGASGGW